jgi:hypothetical protein
MHTLASLLSVGEHHFRCIFISADSEAVPHTPIEMLVSLITSYISYVTQLIKVYLSE